ncbi:MAG TPA: bifunctional 2-polyprenyl-6-hydroxyphenol methylase/3-demethylubiquinol 3-O-methyltransferase UbiG [Thermodesulfobacteriota bacterium]|nr:bifunctional 2-polyprenyl-6-hydroxyphenol methylase/3-demethylubiquinol 3-O-methyltransferase UbiG [Thermodesulfobacteriota bacterium]
MSETEKFNKYGRDWWNPEGGMFALHMINNLRFDYFKGILGEITGRTVLDIGCGGGLLSEEFAKAGARVTGIDLSPTAIDAAKEHAGKSGLIIDYRNCPMKELVDKGEVFDIVICAEMLEHVDDLALTLKESSRLLKDGGYYLFETINKTLKAKFLAVFMAENVLNFVARGTHDYNKFIKPSTLVNLLRQNGIEVKEIKGMSFDILDRKFKISNSTGVNYIGHGIKG